MACLTSVSEPLPEGRDASNILMGSSEGWRPSPWQHCVASQPRYGSGTKALVVSGLREVYTGACWRQVYGGVRAQLSTASRPAKSEKSSHWLAGLLLKLMIFSGELPGDRHKGKLGNRSSASVRTSDPQHRRSHCRLKMNIDSTCWTSVSIKLFWNIQMAFLFSQHSVCVVCVLLTC